MAGRRGGLECLGAACVRLGRMAVDAVVGLNAKKKAFVIKMPTMHRLSCFRDDIIFFIMLYQVRLD